MPVLGSSQVVSSTMPTLFDRIAFRCVSFFVHEKKNTETIKYQVLNLFLEQIYIYHVENVIHRQ